MKINSTIFLLALLFCSSIATFAQDEIDENKMVGFACFFEGRETKLVSRFAKIVKRKRYDTIQEMLTSKNTGERFMAVLCMERLEAVGRVTLTTEEKAVIEQIKTSTDLVAVCSGCFPNPGITLSSAYHSGILLGATEWMERNIKE
jgi:hypothetical protein